MTQHSLAGREQLCEALERFSKSPRFPLLKGVQISRLMAEGDQPTGGIGDLTFEQLLVEIKKDGDISPLLKDEVESLCQLLLALSEDSTESFSESVCGTPDNGEDSGCFDSFGDVPIPTLDADFQPFQVEHTQEEEADDVPVGSVSLEIALRSILSSIVMHQRYDRIRRRKIGEFWDSGWTPAPFEEAMSVEQLAGLDLAVLFKKRMVTDTRIQSIVRALQRVLRALERGDSGQEEAVARREEVQGHGTRGWNSPALNKQGEIPANLPLSIEALAVWEVMNKSVQESPLVAEVWKHFSPEQCVAILLDVELPRAVLRKLSSIVLGLVPVTVRELVSALLRGPGVSVDHIAQAIDGRVASPSAYSRSVGVLVARGLGAEPVAFEGAICPGFWTTQPELMRAIIRDRIAGTRTKHRQASSQSLPAIDLDPILQEWIESRGMGNKNRNGSRNHLKRRRLKGS